MHGVGEFSFGVEGWRVLKWIRAKQCTQVFKIGFLA
jgi:hypothetical protein